MRGQEAVHIGSRYGSKDSYLVSQSVYDVVLVGTGTIRYICRYLVPPRFFDAWLMQVKIPQSSYRGPALWIIRIKEALESAR